MASFNTTSAAIRGVVTCLPSRVIENSYFEKNFSTEEIAKSSQMTGVYQRRYADDGVCTSDLCQSAAEKLLTKLNWEKEEVDALIFLSQTPDHILPATACILQGKLGLSSDVVAFDVNLGCSGYVYGLYLAAKLLDGTSIKKVLLLVGDTCSKFISSEDRSTAMIFGDGGSATALEYKPEEQQLQFLLGTDGAGAENLKIPAGGFRTRPNDMTQLRTQGTDGNLRSQEELYMDGGEIFNFTITSVPRLVKQLMKTYDFEKEEVDAFFLHQANEFMLKHIAKKLKIDLEKVPLTIQKFGNTSSASIPLTLVDWMQKRDLSEKRDLVMAGFGVGYSYAALRWSGYLDVVSEIEYKGSV